MNSFDLTFDVDPIPVSALNSIREYHVASVASRGSGEVGLTITVQGEPSISAMFNTIVSLELIEGLVTRNLVSISPGVGNLERAAEWGDLWIQHARTKEEVARLRKENLHLRDLWSNEPDNRATARELEAYRSGCAEGVHQALEENGT